MSTCHLGLWLGWQILLNLVNIDDRNSPLTKNFPPASRRVWNDTLTHTHIRTVTLSIYSLPKIMQTYSQESTSSTPRYQTTLPLWQLFMLCNHKELHHSTESALIRIQSDISDALVKNCGVMLAKIDLLAAFNTVDHTIFIKLLHDKFAMRGTALDWFRSYLSECQFCMKLGSVRSEPHALDCGVPQGSVLGTVIFNMYTTRLERIIHRHNLCYHKYADDIEIYGE